MTEWVWILCWDTIETPDSRTSKHLQSKEDQESDHQTEETHSFGKGESQNGIWEKLTLEGWVTGITDDQWAEHCSDTWKIIISFWLFFRVISIKINYLPAPDPATPTVAAPAPMNLAAVSISLFWTETESGLKYHFKNNSKYKISRFGITYRTAVRVASLGAERTTRFMFNFWIYLYLLFD